MKRACPYCSREYHLGGIARHQLSCGSRPGPRATPKPPRYGAWWAGGWFLHRRSGVTAYASVAELLEAAR